jgi:hypothetical protein
MDFILVIFVPEVKTCTISYTAGVWKMV